MFKETRKFVLLFIALAVVIVWQTPGMAQSKRVTNVKVVNHALTDANPVPVSVTNLVDGFTVRPDSRKCDEDKPQLIYCNPGTCRLLVSFKVENKGKCSLRFTGCEEGGGTFDRNRDFRGGLSLVLPKGSYSELRVECIHLSGDEDPCDYIISEINTQWIPVEK